MLTPPDHSLLIAAARTALAGGKARARLFELDGRRYVVKRLAEQPRSWLQIVFMRWLVRRVTGQALPLRTLALSQAAGSMGYEAGRLKRLAAAGVRVPPVRAEADDFFVLDYCGTVAATLLEKWTPAEWRAELPRLARELGEFHAAGHWHGGAQIKNVTLHDGQSWRIDFEENFGEFLPLAAAQTADLLLFLNSVSLAGPIDEAEARQLLPQLLDAYFDAHPEPEIRHIVARAHPLLRRLASLARPFRRWSKKGIRRVEILVDLLAKV